MTLLWAIGLLIFGIVVEIYTFQVVRIFGHLDWAERYLGGGGTYTAWKLIGVVLMIVSMVLVRSLF